MKMSVWLAALIFLPTVSFAQDFFVKNSPDFSVTTDSSEIQIYNQLVPRIGGVNDESLKQASVDLLSSLGCHPRGDLLNSLQIPNFALLRYAHTVGVLRKGQTLEIDFSRCADKAGSDTGFWLEIQTRDLSNLGGSTLFNKNTDATVTMIGPSGESLPFNGPVYRNNGYKRALRSLGLDVMPAGKYKLVIKAEKSDVGIGYVTLYYSGGNY